MKNQAEKTDEVHEVLSHYVYQSLNYGEGRHCIAMADAVVNRLTRKSLVPSWGRAANSEKTALRALRRLQKQGGLSSILDKHFQDVHPLEAMAGDLISFPSEYYGVEALGVATGGGAVAAYVTINGVSLCAVDKALVHGVKAWRIPFTAHESDT